MAVGIRSIYGISMHEVRIKILKLIFMGRIENILIRL